MIDGPRHFLDISGLSTEDVRAILDEAHARKAARIDWPTYQPFWLCIGNLSVSVFDIEPMRARAGFEVPMRRLQWIGDTEMMNAKKPPHWVASSLCAQHGRDLGGESPPQADHGE